MVAARTGRSATLDGSDEAYRSGQPSATVGQPSVTVGQPSGIPIAGSNLRRQFLWIATAFLTGWMAAMIVAVAAVLTGIMPTANAQVVVTVATAASSIAMYARFRRLGRIDEVVVLAIMVSWAATIGLLSL